ncbi:MAG TPA: SMI1/KNR4 family protein [Roseateles sp.]
MTTFILAGDWYGHPGASGETLEQLRRHIPPQVPGGYLDLLATTDGGEGALPVQPYNCCLDNAATVLAGLTEAWRRSRLDEGFFVIGGNGGGELLAFDLRKPGLPPIVAVDMVVGAESAMDVAPTVDAFAAMLGHEPAS